MRPERKASASRGKTFSAGHAEVQGPRNRPRTIEEIARLPRLPSGGALTRGRRFFVVGGADRNSCGGLDTLGGSSCRFCRRVAFAARLLRGFTRAEAARGAPCLH